ncbi:hypothetical protein V5N11_015560 [Cardamine amara subsp. amara]|uniref:Retrotransposon Copia-like N-terminal domain-containing protein n=1 Tax=Cardamine amara subsp. amara TaxID=228776 RepID=A0ABD0ZG05_CARAN
MESSKHIALPVTLNGMNYLLWARTTRTNLCGRGLWNHIEAQVKEAFTDGGVKIIIGDSSSEEGKWFQEDQEVLGLLQNSLETAILEAYSYCETEKELWETLKNVYGNVYNLTRVFEVKKAINSLSQEDLEFTKHFGKFSSLWAELEMLRPFSVDPAILKERSEQDKVFGLLLTLNPAFNDLIKHILRSEKLPSLEEVCSQVQREQGSVGLFSGKGEIVMAHKVTFKSEDRKILVCDHCKKRGHTKDKCWVLHPHLKPLKFKGHESSKFKGQANSSQEASTSKEWKLLKINPIPTVGIHRLHQTPWRKLIPLSTLSRNQTPLAWDKTMIMMRLVGLKMWFIRITMMRLDMKQKPLHHHLLSGEALEGGLDPNIGGKLESTSTTRLWHTLPKLFVLLTYCQLPIKPSSVSLILNGFHKVMKKLKGVENGSEQ